MRNSIIVAGVLAVGATAWILSGQIRNHDLQAVANERAEKPTPTTKLISVRVRPVQPRIQQGAVIVNGRTEESRKVTIRAETAGPIAALPVEEGSIVEAGDIIARQQIEDRNARLTQTLALVRQREIEHRAATKLAKKGFRSGTKLAEARTLLDAARAQAKSMRIDLSRTTIKAPFSGILETRYVEKGGFVKIGDNIAKIVDLDPLLAVGFVSERDIGSLKVGGPGRVTLIDGRSAEGTVRFIAAVADAETRSFRVELEVPNPNHRIRSGLTGELNLPVNPVRAHVVSPSVLTLADDGRIGVRVVDDGDIVRFAPTKILSDSPDGLLVSGLKDGQRLITVGHEYVKAGQKGQPVPETAKTGA